MITNHHLRRMSRVELVQYAREGEKQRRRAADELLRRFEVRFAQKGLLDKAHEQADPDAELDEQDDGDGTTKLRSIL